MDTWKTFDQNVVTHSAAHHLMAIDDLIQKRGYARVSDVARALNITRGSVSISLQPLKKSGLIVQDENRHLQLSDSGQSLVDTIKGKRSVLRRFLRDVLGVEPEQAEIDACKLEHLVSEFTAQSLAAFLAFLGGEHPESQRFIAAWHEFTKSNDGKAVPCPLGDTESRGSQHQD